MEKKTLWMIGGGLVLLVLVYAAARSSGGGTNTVSVVPASAPADPNVLAAQVQQDEIRGQIALATINAAGTIDAINAQSQGQVNQIDATYKGQGYLTKLYGTIASALNAQTYTAQLGLASIEGQTATELAQIQSAAAPVPSSSTVAPMGTSTSQSATGSGNRILRLLAGGTPVASDPTAAPPSKPKDCWVRRNIPLVGAFVC